MAEIDLKKLKRAELLEMMIDFSEEAEAARKREEDLRESFEKERLELQREMAEERAQMLKSFDEEKAQMRQKFAEQKQQLQEKFDRDIEGLKKRHDREMKAKDEEVERKLSAIEKSGTLAEAVLNITGMMEKAQEAIDLYTGKMKERAEAAGNGPKDTGNGYGAVSEAQRRSTPERAKESERQDGIPKGNEKHPVRRDSGSSAGGFDFKLFRDSIKGHR